MRKSRWAVSITALAGVFALVIASPALASGRGDNFNHPIMVHSLPSTFKVNDSGATTQIGEPQATTGSGTGCTGDGYDQTVWFTFTPSTNMDVDADTAGSYQTGSTGVHYDTVIAVWTYDGTTWTEIGCNDDNSTIDPNNPVASFIALGLIGGTPYYYQVGSYGSNVYSGAHLVFNIYPD